MDQITPNLRPELPKPQLDTRPMDVGVESSDTDSLDSLSTVSQIERLSSANSAVSQVVQEDSQVTAVPADPITTSNFPTSDLTSSSSSSLIADDVDVIEKVWVQKAKTIVNDTKDNPHDQSAQLSNMKIDYIKKRFNKDIKPSGDQLV
jgi:hypothetical protein